MGKGRALPIRESEDASIHVAGVDADHLRSMREQRETATTWRATEFERGLSGEASRIAEAGVVEALLHFQPSPRGSVVRQDHPRHAAGEGKAETILTMPPHEERFILVAEDHVEDLIAVMRRGEIDIQTRFPEDGGDLLGAGIDRHPLLGGESILGQHAWKDMDAIRHRPASTGDLRQFLQRLRHAERRP